MPILYVHGVATRDSLGFAAMRTFLQRLIAPAISDDPEGVAIEEVFWGGSAATFAWDGRSRPKSRLFGQGAPGALADSSARILASLVEHERFARLPEASARTHTSSGLIAGSGGPRASVPERLSALTDNELSDVLATLIYAAIADEGQAVSMVLAADALARDRDVRDALERAPTAEDEAELIAKRLDAPARASGALVSQGGGGLVAITERLSEALSRSTSVPAYAMSLLAAELRPGINELASLFLGDVFVYLDTRGDGAAPGDIVTRLLEALSKAQAAKESRNNEPLVLITHSMGGQLVYDALTYYLPADAARKDIRVDFWCATASQVGFFEELKLFQRKDMRVKHPDRMPFPHATLGVWWNVWDPNDFISFTAAPIFHGVDDESYDSGLSLVTAHSGYLKRASFFHRLARKLEVAAAAGWRTA